MGACGQPRYGPLERRVRNTLSRPVRTDVQRQRSRRLEEHQRFRQGRGSANRFDLYGGGKSDRVGGVAPFGLAQQVFPRQLGKIFQNRFAMLLPSAYKNALRRQQRERTPVRPPPRVQPHRRPAELRRHRRPPARRHARQPERLRAPLPAALVAPPLPAPRVAPVPVARLLPPPPPPAAPAPAPRVRPRPTRPPT